MTRATKTVRSTTAARDQPLGADLRLARELLGEDLATRDPDAGVGRRHVDDVRRVHVHVDVGVADLLVPFRQHRGLPALRVTEEELYDLGLLRGGRGEGVGLVDVGSDTHHGEEPTRQSVRPPCERPSPTHTNASTMPAQTVTLWAALIIPARKALSPPARVIAQCEGSRGWAWCL